LIGLGDIQLLDFITIEEELDVDEMISEIKWNLLIGGDFLIEELIILKVLFAQVVQDLFDEVCVAHFAGFLL
jgi:hypothetical protein